MTRHESGEVVIGGRLAAASGRWLEVSVQRNPLWRHSDEWGVYVTTGHDGSASGYPIGPPVPMRENTARRVAAYLRATLAADFLASEGGPAETFATPAGRPVEVRRLAPVGGVGPSKPFVPQLAGDPDAEERLRFIHENAGAAVPASLLDGKPGGEREAAEAEDVVTNPNGETCGCGFAAQGEPACPTREGKPACAD